jgi:ATP-dependent helicase HrpB
LVYEGLTIEESRGGKPDAEAAAELLAERAMEQPLSRFVDADEMDALIARAAFAAERSAAIPRVGEDEVRRALRWLCAGKRSFAELEKGDVLGAVRAQHPGLARLEEVAPARVRLAGGRQVKVNYEAGKPPWIASRLQDFFGMRETPLAGGVRVVAHLLGPNGRPVQVTADLAGFWERLYPAVRRELMRRYPRHAWPESP